MRRKERAREHHALMDASDLIYEQAEAPYSHCGSKLASQYTTQTPSPPLATTPDMLLILPAAEASQAPRPPYNRRLEFASDAQPEVNLPVAAEQVQELSLSLPADAQLADDSASPPDSPEIYCSQYRPA